MLSIRSTLILSALILLCGCSRPQLDKLQWEKLPFPTTDNISGFCFVDAKLGFAVTAVGDVFKTADGGKVFQKLGIMEDRKPRNVTFLSDEIGFVYGRQGLLLRTADGGASWTKMGVDSSLDLRKMAFLDKEHGFLVGVITTGAQPNAGIVGTSSDKGLTWKFDTTQFAGFHQLEIVKPTHAWITGADAVMYTTDKGATWQHNASRGRDTVRAVCFSDIANGWLVGDHGLLRYSSDGGWSWHDKPKLTERSLTCAAQPASDVTYIAGDRFIAATVTHGRKWIIDSLNCPNLLVDCQSVGSEIFIAGSGGTILKLKR